MLAQSNIEVGKRTTCLHACNQNKLNAWTNHMGKNGKTKNRHNPPWAVKSEIIAAYMKASKTNNSSQSNPCVLWRTTAKNHPWDAQLIRVKQHPFDKLSNMAKCIDPSNVLLVVPKIPCSRVPSFHGSHDCTVPILQPIATIFYDYRVPAFQNCSLSGFRAPRFQGWRKI